MVKELIPRPLPAKARLHLALEENANLRTRIAALEVQLAEAEGYLRNLLVGFVQEHFPVNTEWAPLEGNLMGMLTQMDNASTIARGYKAQLAALPEPDMVSMSEGTIHLDYEDDDARREAYEWLERYAYSSAPEAQQEPSRPAEQAVTEAMVETMARWICEKELLDPDFDDGDGDGPNWQIFIDDARAALKAAMEAGR